MPRAASSSVSGRGMSTLSSTASLRPMKSASPSTYWMGLPLSLSKRRRSSSAFCAGSGCSSFFIKRSSLLMPNALSKSISASWRGFSAPK